MVARHRLNRLARLEAHHAKSHAGKPKEENLSRLGVVALVLMAYHLGAMQPAESLRLAVARALGYDTARTAEDRPQVDVDLSSLPDFTARYNEALLRLLALAKTDLGVEGDEVKPAVKALFNAMPEWCRQHTALAGFDADELFADVPDLTAYR